MAKKSNGLKAGQYYAAKYRGENGDLIVGRVRSVRTTGEVVLINLLNDQLSTKSVTVLARRNKRISKSQAVEIVETHKKVGRTGARALAVAMKAFGEKQTELPLVPAATREAALNELAVEIDRLIRKFIKDLLTLCRGQVQ